MTTREVICVDKQDYADLLAALQNFLTLHTNARQSKNSDTTFIDTRDWEAFCAQARAAIAKATGEQP
jgi:hypothetical protein